jgi:hypothetical protein
VARTGGPPAAQLTLGQAPPGSAAAPASRRDRRKAKRAADPRLGPDRETYLARYRELTGNAAADFTRQGVFAFDALRAKHGMPRLLEALEGALADPYVRRSRELAWVCSQAGVEHGMKPEWQAARRGFLPRARGPTPEEREQAFRRDAEAGVSRDFTEAAPANPAAA